MNFVLFIFLTLVVLACFFKFYSPHEIKPYFLYYALSVTVLYTPTIYYVFELGNSYHFFSDESLAIYQMISIGIFILIFVADRIANVICPEIVSPPDCANENSSSYLMPQGLKILFFIFVIILSIYILINFDKFTLIKLITTGNLTRRSDTTGELPHWFSMYMLISTLIPCGYFYVTRNKSLLHKIIGFFIVIIFLGIDANKGIIFLFCVYIAIFKFKKLISIKNIFLGLAGMLLYVFLMTGTFNFMDNENSSQLGSSFRRAFVSQGAGIPNRIEMKNNGYIWQHSRISKDVYIYIHGDKFIGTSPTFFAIDFGILWGWQYLFLICLLISLLLAVISRRMLQFHKNDDILQWLYTYLVFVICVSDMFHQLIRFLFILAVAYIYVHSTRKKSSLITHNIYEN